MLKVVPVNKDLVNHVTEYLDINGVLEKRFGEDTVAYERFKFGLFQALNSYQGETKREYTPKKTPRVTPFPYTNVPSDTN